MMRKNRLTLILILINLSVKGYSQEDYIVNQAKFSQTNPSTGMNQLNRVGVLYNSLRIMKLLQWTINTLLVNRFSGQ